MLSNITGLALLLVIAVMLVLLVYYGIVVKLVRQFGNSSHGKSLTDRFTE